MTPREALYLPMNGNDADALTVGGYLQALLRQLWSEQEGFSGKRPFGNSGWYYDLYVPLIRGGATTGTVKEDSEGYWDVIDKGNVNEVVFQCIDALFPEVSSQAESDKLISLALHKAANDFDGLT